MNARGLSPENDQSYRYFMNDNLFNHVNIGNNTNVPNGWNRMQIKACKDYDAIILDQAVMICNYSESATTVISDLTGGGCIC